MTERDYRSIPAINWSTAKHALTSPLHYQHALRSRDDTPAMRLGRAMHALLPTREEFDESWSVYDGTRRGKEWDRFQLVNEGREILTATEYEKVAAMVAAVRANPRAEHWIGPLDQGRRELALTWVDQITGLDCKGRVDWISGRGRMVEFKTTAAPNPQAFFTQAERLGYLGQAAFYTDGLAANDYLLDPPVFVVVQSSPPHDVWCIVTEPEHIAAGRDLYCEALAIIQSCMQTKHWPGAAGDGDIPFRRASWVDSETQENENENEN